jgi:glycine cleavage system regulatory protein
VATQEKNNVVYGLLQIAGPNRPGMVAETCKYVLGHTGNVITCHATRFGRQVFVADIMISAPAENFARIEAGLSAISAHNPRLLRTSFETLETYEPVLLYELTVYAYDKEGIVAEVAALMAGDGLDIVQLSCVSYPAPFGGQPLFMIEMLAEAPSHVAAKQAYANVESLAAFHSWDVYWKPVLKTGVKINPLAVYPPSKLALEPETPGAGAEVRPAT